MSHSTKNIEHETGGSLAAAYHTIDITSLDSAGVENYTPREETGVGGADRFGAVVTGQEDPTVRVSWDHLGGQLILRNLGDGSDVASGTDVGELVIRVKGT